jgi:PPOX class probable F420-dependent enzyme
VSRRDAITMSPEEAAGFLAGEKTLICATNGRDGWPHLMPLWYVLRGDELWSWTYAKSQKTRNLERDPRCTVTVEAGEEYSALRGVMIRAECELVRDPVEVARLGDELAARYGGGLLGDGPADAMRRQAAKRVGMRFAARETLTWDHRKLGGTY